MKTEEQIIICPDCKGDGKELEKHWEPALIDCSTCNGSGRLLMVTTFSLFPIKEKNNLS